MYRQRRMNILIVCEFMLVFRYRFHMRFVCLLTTVRNQNNSDSRWYFLKPSNIMLKEIRADSIKTLDAIDDVCFRVIE